MNTEALQLPPNAIGLLAAGAAGLVIGLERGWRERDVAEGGRVAGLRSFTLVGLLGGVFGVGGAWVLAAGALGLGLLAAASYHAGVRATGNLSATSAIALLLTYGLGALAVADAPALALALSVVAAVLLNLKPALHRGLRLIEHRELSAALQMLVLSAVVLPLLPDADYGPYGALNPYRLWWAVVLIAGLSMSGHIAIRLAGPHRGSLWTGVLGGLASSTATTLALGRRVRVQPQLLGAASAGTLAACAVMFVRIVVVLGTLAPALAWRLLMPAAAAAAVLAAAAWREWRGDAAAASARDAPGAPAAAAPADLAPFDLGAALGFAALLGAVSVLTRAGRDWLGDAGLYALALLSGIADVDAITVSLARMSAGDSAPVAVAAVAVALAVLANLVAKAALAAGAGGAAFGRRIALPFAVAAIAGAAAMAAPFLS